MNPTMNNPTNNPRTGIIAKGAKGILFAGTSFMKGQYAFSPLKGDTRWFKTYAGAKADFRKAHRN